ncbi:MAG: NAD(P)/FAD-dependent oxidoreductase [Clostridia bacterium]|nr:NAD(P)/FAD-dependent oxidoreductase [Clostridia bacterium]
MVLINGISLPLSATEEDAFQEARRRLRGVHLLSSARELSLYRRSVDARKKKDIRLVYGVAVTLLLPDSFKKPLPFPVLEQQAPEAVYGEEPLSAPPVVVGSGPCGLFCALLLAEHGYRPVLLERGGSVEERKKAVSAFAQTRLLDTECNIQFGAGGAGTFSDGKLVTRVNDSLCRFVLETFVSYGAPSDILTSAKPHIGTDILCVIVERMLEKIEKCGGRVLYHTKMTGIRKVGSRAVAVETNHGEIPLGALVLATGHSARDTYQMLMQSGFSIEPKPFSVGFRIEHKQEDIDKALYGDFAGHPKLAHAEYALSHNTKERGVYTFCMCPGGEVVAGSSEEGGVVVNGMSNRARDGENANSAVLCSVFPEDYGQTPQGAIAFARGIEQAAFAAGGGDYSVPLSTVGDFLSGKIGTEPERIRPTYMGGNAFGLARPEAYLPAFVCEALRNGLLDFDNKIDGFAISDAVLSGAETRTSAPLRLLRTAERTALGFANIYPAGEGAGYAGGITSAAIDGVRTALSLMKTFAPQKDF